MGFLEDAHDANQLRRKQERETLDASARAELYNDTVPRIEVSGRAYIAGLEARVQGGEGFDASSWTKLSWRDEEVFGAELVTYNREGDVDLGVAGAYVLTTGDVVNRDRDTHKEVMLLRDYLKTFKPTAYALERYKEVLKILETWQQRGH